MTSKHPTHTEPAADYVAHGIAGIHDIEMVVFADFPKVPRTSDSSISWYDGVCPREVDPFLWGYLSAQVRRINHYHYWWETFCLGLFVSVCVAASILVKWVPFSALVRLGVVCIVVLLHILANKMLASRIQSMVDDELDTITGYQFQVKLGEGNLSSLARCSILIQCRDVGLANGGAHHTPAHLVDDAVEDGPVEPLRLQIYGKWYSSYLVKSKTRLDRINKKPASISTPLWGTLFTTILPNRVYFDSGYSTRRNTLWVISILYILFFPVRGKTKTGKALEAVSFVMFLVIQWMFVERADEFVVTNVYSDEWESIVETQVSDLISQHSTIYQGAEYEVTSGRLGTVAVIILIPRDEY